VRLFAHQYPAETAGLVLVDARPEQLFSISTFREQADSGLGISKMIAFLTDLGLARLFVALAPDKVIPAAAVPYYAAQPGSYAIVFQSKMFHAAYAEALAIDTSDAQVVAIGSLGDLPLVVIRHGKSMFGSFPPEEAAKIEQQWQAFQEAIAGQSSAGQVMVATDSGHLIQLEQPGIIIEAVQQLLGILR
jgi:pimeloyl-ACP methyl ester carboxylesterase